MAYYGYKPAEQAIQIGDNTIVSADITDGSIVNADLNASAAIAMSKTQLVAGTGITLATNTLNVDAAQTQITSVGTIGTGVWQGTKVASAYLDDDTAHLSGSTFTGTIIQGDLQINTPSSNISQIKHNNGSGALNLLGDQVNVKDKDGNTIASFNDGGATTFAGNVTLSGSSTTRYLFLNSGGNGGVWQEGNYELRFGTNDTERMKIESDGTVVMNGALQPSGNVSIGGYVKATNGIRTSTGTERYLIFGEGNELNTYTSSGVGDSNRATLHINHLGAGSKVDLSDSELVVEKGTGSTFGGHVLVSTDNSYDLGSSSKGWRNIYTNDLNLSNMKSDGNDIDGTKGSWTIQEGEDDLFLINRTNGKKYKFKLEMV